MSKKKDEKDKDKQDKDDSLKGFDIKINEFGEITTNLEIDRVNNFLNENVDDKKLRDNKNEEEED